MSFTPSESGYVPEEAAKKAAKTAAKTAEPAGDDDIIVMNLPKYTYY